jgi:hypothetical protein
MTDLPAHPDLSAHDGNVAVLRSDVARTRADLGATLEALVAKTDVRSRVQDRVGNVRKKTTSSVRSRAGMSAGVAAVLLAGLVAAGWWGISRRRSASQASLRKKPPIQQWRESMAGYSLRRMP